MELETSERVFELIEDFLNQCRRGEAPSIEELISAHPECADEIRYCMPVISMFELAAETHAAQETLAKSRTEHELVRGEQFGRYQVQDILGRGGMGTVYLAHDTELERDVALKIPHFDVSDEKGRTRFLREARTMAKLHHRNLCPVFDAGEIDGSPFLTMAYIKGQTLKDEVGSRQEHSNIDAAQLIHKLASALQVAHDAGIIHRDLKPANIMIDHEAEPIIMDFGLARRHVAEESEITEAGSIVGSPAYMAPEQLESDQDSVDYRADIYGLGVILYELLCGRPPFVGSTLSVMKGVAVGTPTALRELRTDVDRELEKICLVALSKSPQDRYRSMEELARALNRLCDGPSSESNASVSVPQVNRQTWIATAMGVVGFIAVFVMIYTGDTGNETVRETLGQASAIATTPPASQSEADRNALIQKDREKPEPEKSVPPLLVDSGQRLGKFSTRAVQLADLDGDGDLDAFVGCSDQKPDRIYFNDGKGSFTDSGQNLGQQTTYRVALGDVDGDNDIDAVTSGKNRSHSTLWLNDGHGDFVESKHLLPKSPHANIVDVDMDGDLDLYICGFNDANLVLTNDGKGRFGDSGQRLGIAPSNHVAFGDLDGDGDQDAYVDNQDSSDVVYINVGDGMYQQTKQKFPKSGAAMVQLADWNQDGHPDAAVCTWGEHVQIWINDGKGNFIFESQHPIVGLGWHSVQVGDINMDGIDDLTIICSSSTGRPPIYVCINSGSGLEEGTVFGSGRATDGALGDLDGDGDLDLFLARDKNQPDEVWLNQTDRSNRK